MGEMCKHQLKDTKASTWNNTVYRHCKLESKRDGYCDLHHPENVAIAIERAAMEEIVREARESEKREESMVGTYMRLKERKEFDAILAKIRESEELIDELRRRRREVI